MRNPIYAIVLIFLAGCSTTAQKTVQKYQVDEIQVPDQKTVYVSANYENPLVFQGEYDFDELRGAGTDPLYPGYNAATFLAGIAIHAVAESSGKSRREQQVIDQANRVVEKYQPYIDKHNTGAVLQTVLTGLSSDYPFGIEKKNPELDVQTLDGWFLQITPIFYLTQDEREIVLKNIITVSETANPDKILSENLIEVVSTRNEETALLRSWTGDDLMVVEAGNLLALSLKLFIDDVMSRHANESEVQKTFRFNQGGEKKYQRGNLVASSCGRTVIRTLRGWLLSLPDSALRHSAAQPVTPQVPGKTECSVDYFDMEKYQALRVASAA